jgi:peptidoglycan-associated lipoprotein
MRRTYLFILMAAGLVAGCSSSKKPSTTPPPAPPVAHQVPPPAAPPPAAATAPNVAVSDELLQQCRLKFSNPRQAPKFDYDRTELDPQDRDVLDQVAQCLTNGPLQGRAIELIGRTDPRGTEEYNLGLGARRAETVSAYLERLGVPSRQLERTTRGEIDASGTDEESWRTDRRVDVKLAN